MPCSSASTLKTTAAIPLPNIPGLSAAQNQAFKIWAQQVLSQIQGAAGVTGVNVIPQQYALVAGSTLPPISSTSNCSVSLDATKALFGYGSYKIAITGTPATVTFSLDTAWPIHPNWQWIISFFQQASAAISSQITITTPVGSYSTAFTTTLSASGWERLADSLNLGADASASFGLSVTFTGGTGQDVWLDGLMLEPYFGTVMQPSPFISTSAALTQDNLYDGATFVRLLGSHASGNVAYNFKGIWSSATTYVVGDEVLYGDSYWLAIAGSTNSAPATSNASWQVVGTYSGFQGAWSSTTAYVAGAEVTYNGNFWVCVTANTNSAPTTSNANWQIAGPANLDNVADGSTYARTLATYLASGRPFVYQGAYSNTPAYHIGDEVSYSGNYYLCTTATTAGTLPTNTSYWQLLGPTSVDAVPDGSTYVRLLASHAIGNIAYNFKGVWSSATSYVQGDEVVYGQSYWIALSANSNSAPTTSNAHWQVVGSYSGYQGAWSSVTAYVTGAEVTYNGNYWICVTGNTNSAPTTSNANWVIAGPSSLDNIADGSTYARTLATYLASGRPYNYQGTYSGATTYHQGDQVVYSGNFYLYINASATSGNAPTNTAYWELLGPATLDNLVDGTTYARILAGYLVAGRPYAFQGIYSGSTTYHQGDEVLYSGCYYLCIATTTGNAPPNQTYWELIGSPGQFLTFGTFQVTDTHGYKNGGSTAWDSGAASILGFSDCHISAKNNLTGNNRVIFGLCTAAHLSQILSTASGGNAFSLVDFGLYNGGGVAWQVCELGSSKGALSTGILTSDTGNVTCDGSTVRYYLNGKLGYTSLTASGGATLYGVIIAYDTDGGINSIEYGPTVVQKIIHPSGGQIGATGSVPPFIFNPQFAYTSTTTSLTLSWPAFTVYRMDGTTVSVAANSSYPVTGLTANTSYTFYPYVAEGATTVSFATGYSGSAGSPAVAYAGGSGPAAAAAYNYANIPLQSFTFATPASGTGGGGGDSFGCLHPDQPVALANGCHILADRLQEGDELPGPSGAVRVRFIKRLERSTWIKVRAGKHDLTVTEDHRFIRPDDSEVRACELSLGEILAGDGKHLEVTQLTLIRQRTQMVCIEFDAPHLYYLNGTLSHNPKP